MQNLTPADVYFGKGQTILLEREGIQRENVWRQRSILPGVCGWRLETSWVANTAQTCPSPAD